jgi:methyltransferase family protein
MTASNPICPLCGSGVLPFFQGGTRSYLSCKCCKLIFVPTEYHLSPNVEKQRYEFHENDPDDPRYRNFLSKLTDPLLKYIGDNMKGLDYGSGPGPAISVILGELGFEVSDYDPIFANNPNLLKMNYDFVTCTEVVEHFRNAFDEWTKLIGLLKPGGILGVMTTLYDDSIDFGKWHYRRDDTHLSFYSNKTFEWIERNFNLTREYSDSSVIILRKS